MKVNIEIELKPFQTPNFALVLNRKERDGEFGGPEETSIPLSKLDAITLDKMCDEFRSEVFRKAGKTPPPQCYQG